MQITSEFCSLRKPSSGAKNYKPGPKPYMYIAWLLTVEVGALEQVNGLVKNSFYFAKAFQSHRASSSDLGEIKRI